MQQSAPSLHRVVRPSDFYSPPYQQGELARAPVARTRSLVTSLPLGQLGLLMQACGTSGIGWAVCFRRRWHAETTAQAVSWLLHWSKPGSVMSSKAPRLPSQSRASGATPIALGSYTGPSWLWAPLCCCLWIAIFASTATERHAPISRATHATNLAGALSEEISQTLLSVEAVAM